MSPESIRRTALSAAVASALTVSPAMAQSESNRAGGMEEIIVTASARETTVMDIPYNISAVSGDDLEQLRRSQFETMNRAAESRNRLASAEDALERNEPPTGPCSERALYANGRAAEEGAVGRGARPAQQRRPPLTGRGRAHDAIDLDAGADGVRGNADDAPEHEGQSDEEA